MDDFEVDNTDFRKLGFKCGVEIHQQIETEKKLFCRCPARYVEGSPDTSTMRHMRPTLSELGEYDGTALMEFKTRKDVIYLLYGDVVCTYEMDDTPPFMVNEEAVDVAITIALALNCKIVDELHITRKQYLDGSIPTGFQRTGIIGLGGSIPYKNRKINIDVLTLEEDACREVSDEGHTITFKTDRLGFPLVEIITAPDMQTPDEVPEVVWKIARMVRATGLVRRGIGSVRQDVNVSITGGTRCEIKGVPKIGMFRKLTAVEALRQKALLDMKDELKKKGFKNETSFKFLEIDATDKIQHLLTPEIEWINNEGYEVKLVIVKGFAGFTGYPTQPGKSFYHELEGRVRVIACLDRLSNILSPEVMGEGLPTDKQWGSFLEDYEIDEDDGVVVVYGKDEDLRTAMEEIKIRITETINGVPNETRQALMDGTTTFERILPGADRMYPDTDHPPKPISEERVEKARSFVPEAPWDVEKRYEELGLHPELARPLANSEYTPIFDRIVASTSVRPAIVADALISKLKHLKRKGVKTELIEDEDIFNVFERLDRKEFFPEVIGEVMEKIADDKIRVETAIEELDYEKVSEKEVMNIVENLELTDMRVNPDSSVAYRYLMGEAMKQLRGCFSGKRLSEIINKRIKKLLDK
jgi:glutamyl-tRNA(Gln) amidotransferase subunit E